MPEALNAADKLSEIGISAEVVSMHTIKPLDEKYLSEASKKFKQIVTIEEHGLIGGLSSAISEWKALNDITVPQLAFGTPDEFMHEVGSQDYARGKYGLIGESIFNKIIDKYSKL